MGEIDFSLVRKMNLNADCIMANQTDNTSKGDVEINGYKVTVLNSTIKGLAANRNLALDNSKADIVLFADDDMVYRDDMPQGVVSAFAENPKADVIIFGCTETDAQGNILREYASTNKRKIGLSALKYPTYIIAARRKSLKRKKIRFSQMFGIGSAYSLGEGTVFLADCFKKFLRVYTSDFNIGTSSKELHWFQGYTDKFFFDKGALYRHIFGPMAPLYALYYSRKYEKLSGVSHRKIMKYMEDGIVDYAKKIKANKLNKSGM
jgi:glycosyltransferase involved in cell wall biosynthesis